MFPQVIDLDGLSFSNRHHRPLAVDNGGVASARVIGTVGGHGADLFDFGDLVEQFRQDRTVTFKPDPIWTCPWECET